VRKEARMKFGIEDAVGENERKKGDSSVGCK
jgi:hypothetical protein